MGPRASTACLPRFAAALALALGAGCLGDFVLPAQDDASPFAGLDADPARTSAPDGGASLRDVFTAKVLPILDGNCVQCHSKDGGAGPAFLRPDEYDTLRAYPGMIARDPMTSRLLTKGQHAGPRLTADQVAAFLPWLAAEAASLPSGSLDSAPATPPAVVVAGPNLIRLGPLGADFADAAITFNARVSGAALILSDIQVHAGDSAALHIIHPLFIIWSSGKKSPDPVDSFSNLDEAIARSDTQPLGPGTLVLNNVGALDLLSIAFHTIEVVGASHGDGGAGGDGDAGADGGATAGCKAVMAFVMSARPMLAQRCYGCHGGMNPAAANALDMTKIDDNSPTGKSTACQQIKSRVNTAMPLQSAIFITTDPKGNVQHPFKFPDSNSFDAFEQMVKQWIDAEK